MLSMVRLGLLDMEGSDPDRVLFGFCGVAVFGRSVTLAMQHLRSFDEAAFNKWYEPWRQEMEADPLLLFFYGLRTHILHGIRPQIGITMNSFGLPPFVRPGSVNIDAPYPDAHLGKTLEDTSMENLCRLYLAYLQAMFDSLVPVVWEVHDRLAADASTPGEALG